MTVTSVPRLTWAALVSQRPTFEDGQWHWRAAAEVLGVSYSGDLTAYADQGDVVAEVRVSSPAVTDFLWYDLHAPIGGRQGQWRIYDAHQPSTPTVVGTIDWSHPVTGAWNLTFTAVGGENPGDNLSYAVGANTRTVLVRCVRRHHLRNRLGRRNARRRHRGRRVQGRREVVLGCGPAGRSLPLT